MDTLPAELHHLLFSFIPRIQDRCNLSSTCRYFRKLYLIVDPYLDEKKKIVRENVLLDRVKYEERERCNWGMRAAAEGGHADLVRFFMEKGATDWDMSMRGAAEGGHAELVRFFVTNGATDWERGMIGAGYCGHAELVRFFIEKGATNWE